MTGKNDCKPQTMNDDQNIKRQSLIQGEVHDELEKKLIELSALFEISQMLNSSLNLVSIADNILLSPMGRMMISKGIFLLHRGENLFEVYTLKGLSRDLIGKRISILDLPYKPFLIRELGQAPAWMEFFEQFDMKLFLPVTLRNDVFGLIAYGKKLFGGDYRESEIEFLSSVASIAATSIQNGIVFEELQKVNTQLDKKIQELNTLFDIGKGLQATLDAEKIIKLLSYGLMGEMMISKYIVLVKRNEETVTADQKGFPAIPFSKLHYDLLFNISHPYLVEEDESGELNLFLQNHDIHAVIPMRSQDRTKGVLLTGIRMTRQTLTGDDINFLYTLGNQAMLSLENAWLFEDSLERKRLEEELELARQIQVGLLPKSFPDITPFEVYGVNISSKQVGGDYFDIIRIDEDHYIIAIADVSGKGVPASLLMSNLQAGLLALSGEVQSFDRLVSRINNIIFINTGSDKFITFFGGILDLKAGTFTYVNAGHNPPYKVRQDGTLKTLDLGGLILGMLPDMTYEHGSVLLEPGESIVMFTDGVTEAMNESGDQYEEARLEELIVSHHHSGARDLTDKIVQSVSHFAGHTPQSDDITVVVITRPCP